MSPIERRARDLHTRLLTLADVTAEEAGLTSAGDVLTLALQSSRPWAGVDYRLARAAKRLRDLAERPLVISAFLTRP